MSAIGSSIGKWSCSRYACTASPSEMLAAGDIHVPTPKIHHITVSMCMNKGSLLA